MEITLEVIDRSLKGEVKKGVGPFKIRRCVYIRLNDKEEVNIT